MHGHGLVQLDLSMRVEQHEAFELASCACGISVRLDEAEIGLDDLVPGPHPVSLCEDVVVDVSAEKVLQVCVNHRTVHVVLHIATCHLQAVRDGSHCAGRAVLVNHVDDARVGVYVATTNARDRGEERQREFVVECLE